VRFGFQPYRACEPIGVNKLFLDCAQFAVESMFGFVHLEPILQEEFCFLNGSSQLRVLVQINGSRDGVGEMLEAVFQFSNPFDDLRR